MDATRDQHLRALPADRSPSFQAVGRLLAELRDSIVRRDSDRLAEIERRLAALEATVSGTPLGVEALPTYRGVYRADQTYREGDFATDRGSLWYCRAAATSTRPGDNPTAWQLAVKQGRGVPRC